MTLPPWLRVVQQSYITHLATAAAIAGGTIAFTCFAKDNILSLACVRAGLIAAGIYLFGSLQYSPGSSSFTSDGNENKPVGQVVAAQKAEKGVRIVVSR